MGNVTGTREFADRELKIYGRAGEFAFLAVVNIAAINASVVGPTNQQATQIGAALIMVATAFLVAAAIIRVTHAKVVGVWDVGVHMTLLGGGYMALAAGFQPFLTLMGTAAVMFIWGVTQALIGDEGRWQPSSIVSVADNISFVCLCVPVMIHPVSRDALTAGLFQSVAP